MKKSTQNVTVKKDEVNPEPTEIIAKSIIGISDAMDKINKGQLNRKALLILIQSAIPTGSINRNQIENVLNCLTELKRIYLKPTKP